MQQSIASVLDQPTSTIAVLPLDPMIADAARLWSAWRAEHPRVDFHDETIPFAVRDHACSTDNEARNRIANSLVPIDAAALGLAAADPRVMSLATCRIGFEHSDVGGIVREAIASVIFAALLSSDGRAMESQPARPVSLDGILTEARSRWAEWRRNHPRPTEAEAQAMTIDERNQLGADDVDEVDRICEALLPSDSLALFRLGMDERALNVELDFVANNAARAVRMALEALIDAATLEGERATAVTTAARVGVL